MAGGFLGIEVKTDELEALVSAQTGCAYRLKPIAVKCTYPVFRGEAAGAPPAFVKIGPPEEWARTFRVLEAIASTGLVPRMLVKRPLDYRGFAVFVMEWLDVKTVFPEDMTDRQADSFVDGAVRLAQALQRVADYIHVDEGPSAPDRLYAVLADYARRHPWCSRAFADLLAVPEAQRTFGARKRAVTHGDFHAKNFGFRGDSFAGVFDFGQVCDGLACGDFVNALVERFSCLGMPADRRRRLRERARWLLARAPWPAEDMAVAANLRRLDFAARRILKHPNSLWVAWDVERRDRKIREILSCMPGANMGAGTR